MSAVDLLQPILDGGLQRNNFFNGRLLSAEDLRAEQNANRTQHRHLSRALGDGIAWGLGVSVKSSGEGRAAVSVTAGVALNHLGDILYLPNDADVALVPAERAAETADGMFVECEPPRPTATLRDEGAYVLVISPTSGYSGTALVSDPNTTSAGRGACGARFSVEGVRFRLVPMSLAALTDTSSVLRSRITGLLPPRPGNVAARERLRNLLAHFCFGTEDLRSYFADPLRRSSRGPGRTGWGALDAMRSRGDITKCDVPLALIVLSSGGITFADMWTVRRRLLDASAIDSWRGVAGPRRVAEAEAAFLQFQSQLEIVRGAARPSGIAASTYFDALPPAGWLPTGTRTAFNWSTFLGAHAPPSVTPVDAALLRGIIERSWFDEPFLLFGSEPPVPLRVYQVPGESFVVFARSGNGNVRVFLTPVPAGDESVIVTSTARNGQAIQSIARTSGTVPVTDLEPGTHAITVTAPDYLPVPPLDVEVVGGRTTDVTIALTPIPNGSIIVTAIDENTTLNIGSRVSSITATATSGGETRSGVLVPSTGKWLIEDVPAGSYTLSGVAHGYELASSGRVGPVTRGEQTSAVLTFEPVIVRRQPSTCVMVNDARKPPLGRIQLCMVLAATEFEDLFYFGEYSETVVSKKASGGRYTTANRKVAAKKRAAPQSTSRTGEKIFSQAPWLGMQPLEPETDDVRKWLLDWREWFAEDLEDPMIRKSNPVVFVDPQYRPAATKMLVRTSPPAYAVFGRFAVPLLIKVESLTTKAPVPIDRGHMRGLPKHVIDELVNAEIFFIDDLAWAWGDLVMDITDSVVNPAKQLILDASRAVVEINETRNYYEGVDQSVNTILIEAGIMDDVALANADIAELGVLLNDVGFATRLVEQARDIVPESSWSLMSLGIGAEQAAVLEREGYSSLGDVAAHSGDDRMKETFSKALGLESESPEARDAAVEALGTEAVLVMTEHSVALIPEVSIVMMKGVDAITADKLVEGGLLTTDALAAAEPEAVVEIANVTLEVAESMVAAAQSTSRGAQAVSILAPVSTGEAGRIDAHFGGTVTLSGIAAMTRTELGTALGGDEARAGALIDGVTAGMAGMTGGRMR